MENYLGKFNLYELFRILLPGTYSVYLIYEFIRNYDLLKDFYLYKEHQTYWYIVVLIVFIFSLILGSLIYALDLCRVFKNCIKNIPTNLLTHKYPRLFPRSKERENEHKYYSWYEKSKNKSKIKTELQSGLYHMSINIAFVSIFGILLGLILLCKGNGGYILTINFLLLFFSSLSAFCLVNRRLRWQWQRNYWEYETEEITSKNTKHTPPKE